MGLIKAHRQKFATVFWDEDTQIDFISPEGKLYVPGAEAIVPNLKILTLLAKEHGIPVLASTDAHRTDDSEMAVYPLHCLIGTAGQEKVEGTLLPKRIVIPNHLVQLPTDFSEYDQIILQKQDVDVFTNPNIENLLSKLGSPQFVLYGVVTEICVAIAARGLLNLGYKVEVVEDAIRSFDAAKGAAALDEIQKMGGTLVATDQVVARYAGVPR